VTEESLIGMADILNCSVFEVLDLEIEDYLYWQRASADHNERVKKEMEKK